MGNIPNNQKISSLKKTLEDIMAPTKELAHGAETLQWLLKIKPNSDWQIQISAFAHDIERAVPFVEGKYPPKPEKDDHNSYDSYKQAHALRSAEIVGIIMKDQHFLDSDIAKVYSAIKNHEIGGDTDSDLVRNADSIRWFDKGFIKYIEKSGLNGAKEKGWWMFKRANKETKELILSLTFDESIKQYIKNNVSDLPYRQGVYGLLLNDIDQILLVFKRNI